jgi:transcriptional regulator with XRE-family HTH domain
MSVQNKLQRLTRLHNQNALARAAGISKSALRDALSGARKPHNGTLLALALALDVDPDWLADDSKSWPPVRNPSEVRVVAVA